MGDYRTGEVVMSSDQAKFIKDHRDKLVIIHDAKSDIHASVYPGVLCNPNTDDYEFLKDKVILEISDMSVLDDIEVMAHEFAHIEQLLEKILTIDNDYITWNGVKVRASSVDPIGICGRYRYYTSPWELQAYRAQYSVKRRVVPFWLWYLGYVLGNW